MAVAIEIDALEADLIAFAEASKKFVADWTRLDRLRNQLVSATAQARQGGGSVIWSTKHGGSEDPVRTKFSKDYRSFQTLTKEIFAEISFAFTGALDPSHPNRLIVAGGKTSLKIQWRDAPESTECHFDIHPGTIGHPMLHVQFEGKVKEVPRIFSVLAHPLDVLEFALMEVFQQKWRDARVGVAMQSRLQKYTLHQRSRLVSTIENYCQLGKNPNKSPLVSLQGTPVEPIDFYPRGSKIS
ncbi:hypothetical protein ACVW1C_005831 [Bradyrhizobium sp. USDA 4011]